MPEVDFLIHPKDDLGLVAALVEPLANRGRPLFFRFMAYDQVFRLEKTVAFELWCGNDHLGAFDSATDAVKYAESFSLGIVDMRHRYGELFDDEIPI